MKLFELLNKDLLNKMIQEKYLNVQKHPDTNLWIYNYSKSCQLNKIWNDVTCVCRGLIIDADNNIVARPFEKFWNYEELSDKSVIPNLPFEAYEKLDGSLGIMYWIEDTPYICTRGSFTSAQGQHATEILHNNYSEYFHLLDKSKTYLFEIIWDEDHHCISYGDTDDIFLLAILDTETGKDEDIYAWEHIFKCTKRYDGVDDFLKIREMFSGDNREGFVIKFSNGYRLKMKYENYFKIHFLRCALSEKNIFNMLSTGNFGNINAQNVEDIINELDEENQIYYNKIVDKFKTLYSDIECYCKDLISLETFDNDDTMSIINTFKNNKYSGILFKMWREQPYEQTIWNYIKKYHLKNENSGEE